MKKQKITFQSLYQRLLRVTRAHFYLVLAYFAATIVFDSWNLYTHEVIFKRWLCGGFLAIITCLVWFGLKRYGKSQKTLAKLAYVLILADILFASLNVYLDRGMASKYIVLFVLPLVVATQLMRRSVLLASAGISAAAYSIATVSYFHIFYGEGYRIQLYGEVGFYCALIFFIALMLMPLINKE